MKSKYGLMKILLILLAVVICGVIYSCASQKSESTEETSGSSDVSESSSDTVQDTLTETEEDTSCQTICVHVCGAVNDPGVYYLDEGSRVHQAVDAAGGFTANAATDYVNLADIISDGQQIYIPTSEEAEESGLTPAASQADADDGIVNINTADASELALLPGIGESKAQAIITYRENVSQFEDIEDIKNVSGIGDSVYEKIKDSIKVK